MFTMVIFVTKWCFGTGFQGKDNPRQPCPPQASDICTVMYTSGTSGQPKGVMLTHESHAMYVKGVDLFMDQFDDKVSHILHWTETWAWSDNSFLFYMIWCMAEY